MKRKLIIIFIAVIILLGITIFFMTRPNAWKPITTIGAPEPRWGHTAIWTGYEMVIWGGQNDTRYFRNGGRYAPEYDLWTAMATEGAPEPRAYHTAIWTGDKMIIWGGALSTGGQTNTGGIYDPNKDKWMSITTEGAPDPRMWHEAVWTGSKMIVWGGCNSRYRRIPKLKEKEVLNIGCIYDPEGNKWTTMTTEGAPELKGWYNYAIIWAKDKLVVLCWYPSGGEKNGSIGAIYYPDKDKWESMSTKDIPESVEAVVWTGEKIFAFSGLSLVSIFDPQKNQWDRITPSGLQEYKTDDFFQDDTPDMYIIRGWKAIWTGQKFDGGEETYIAEGKVLVWGGETLEGTSIFDIFSGHTIAGWLYNPKENRWSNITKWGRSSKRSLNTTLWTGKSIIVWGGAYIPEPFIGMHAACPSIALNTGGIYVLEKDR